MTYWICKEVQTDNGGYFEPVKELIRCKDCKYYLKSDEKCQLIDTRLHFYETGKRWTEDIFCAWAERKEENESL